MGYGGIAMERRYIIVGIDPGTTVGLAMLDLQGTICALYSSKDMSKKDIIERIVEVGTPVIIATDVDTLPQTVEKVSASFEAKLHIPRTSISLREKNEMARGLQVANAHERDALAAAVKAYQAYRGKFDNIDARLAQLGKSGLAEDVKALTLKEYSVTEALLLLDPPPKKEYQQPQPAPKRETGGAPSIGPLKARIRNQSQYIAELESRLAAYKKEIKSFERRMARRDEAASVRAAESSLVQARDRRIAKLEKERARLRKSNRRMAKEITELRGVQELRVHSDLLVCNVLRQFTRQELESLAKTAGIKGGDVLFVEDSSGGGAATAHKVASYGVRAIISQTEMSHTALEILEAEKIPVFGAGAFDIRREGTVAIMEKKRFEEGYAEWERAARMQEKARKTKWLEGLIDTYRHERKKGEK
jgi:predicted RNase H-like nuclease (RuvC/YqgF family)